MYRVIQKYKPDRATSMRLLNAGRRYPLWGSFFVPRERKHAK
jgi:hypothetical protein